MNPLDLTPEQHAALYAAARQRAETLRHEARAAALNAAVRWLRRLAMPAAAKEIACHS